MIAALLIAAPVCISRVGAQTLTHPATSNDASAVDATSCRVAADPQTGRPFLIGSDPRELRDSLRTSAGQAIRAVHILPNGLGAPIDQFLLTKMLHATTRAGTIRNLLLFAPGDTLDTLRVAESMRSLRRTRFLADAGLSIARCGEGRGVAITVTTRDAWSARATLRWPGSSGAAGVALEESNLLGTGRVARVYARTDNGRTGVGVSYTDPWFGRSSASLTIARSVFRDGGEWFGGLRSRERSVLDPWRAALTLSRATRVSLLSAADTVQRDRGTVLAERRVSVSPSNVTFLLAGAESQRTLVTADTNALLVGPRSARRSFLGLDVGLARRSLVYAPIAGLLGGSRNAELPLGLETELVLGLGRDAVARVPALHADFWAGRIWTPRGHMVLSADTWASGYRIDGGWQSATARASLSALRPVRSGLWSARVSVEVLADPDPDTRALASIDPAVYAFPSRGLAEEAIAGSIERTFPVTGLHHGYALELAGFALGSVRWDPATVSGTRLHVGALGIGLRLNPASPGRPMVRLDVGLPLLHAPELGNRPFVRVSFSPWIEAGRHRDGRRP